MSLPDERSMFDPRHARDVPPPPPRDFPPPPRMSAGYPVLAPIRRTIVPMSGLAACSITLGILAFATFGATGIPAAFTGHRAMRDTWDGARGGHGLACVGAMLGWFAIVGWCLFWLLMLTGGLRGLL